MTSAPDRAIDVVVDGRRLRSERSRDAVVDALLSLYEDGHLRPGVALIAERAGVSERSVFRHFEDLDSLIESAADRQFAKVGHLFAPPETGGPRAVRVAALVEQRLTLHDAIAPVLRAAVLLEPDSERIREMFAWRRSLLNQQVERQFATELQKRSNHDAAELLDALGAASGVEAVEHLRHHLGLARPRAAAALARTLFALLSSRKADS
jgi:TetR/AcrR family transcriptional regulator, regulator of autoinduction and epiphytic fitness